MLSRLLLLVVLFCSAAFGQLAQYGYVIGILDPTKSFLEKIDPADKGKFLHYHVFLKTAANVQYEVVIDVNDVSPTKPLIYRIASLNAQTAAELTANFGPVLGATSDFHIISNTEASFGPILNLNDDQKKAAGALDYIRHPGLLQAERNLPWQNMLAVTTADPLQWALPLLDALFKGPAPPATTFTKLYVFGAPFTSGGTGMHVVHQNQGDSGTTFSKTNATWQDGGIIIEQHSVRAGPGRGAPSISRTSRSVLMTKFSNQSDFTAESNDVSLPALGILPGHLIAPTTVTSPVGLICGDFQDFGPFSAAQLEVSTSAASGVPFGSHSAPKIEVRVKNGAFLNLNDPGDFIVLDNSTDPSAKGRAFARAYSPMSILARPIITFPTIKFDFVNVRSSFYVRLHAIDPGSVCDSEASATLKVSKY
jgi:hypothetical protein